MINPLYTETPKRILLHTVKTQMKCDISLGSALFVQTKMHFFKEKFNPTPKIWTMDYPIVTASNRKE